MAHDYFLERVLMESGYIKLSPRYASIISSGCGKTKLCQSSLKNQNAETVSYALFLKSVVTIKFYKNKVLSKMKNKTCEKQT